MGATIKLSFRVCCITQFSNYLASPNVDLSERAANSSGRNLALAFDEALLNIGLKLAESRWCFGF